MFWVLLFALVCWILFDLRPGAGLAGGLALLTAVALHLGLGGASGVRVSPLGAARFLPYFLVQSARGGLDVSRRALAPSLPLSPRMIRYSVRLPAGPPRVFFVGVISLLPGTFSAELHDDELTVHLLATDVASRETLHTMERKVGEIFGLALR